MLLRLSRRLGLEIFIPKVIDLRRGRKKLIFTKFITDAPGQPMREEGKMSEMYDEVEAGEMGLSLMAYENLKKFLFQLILKCVDFAYKMI